MVRKDRLGDPLNRIQPKKGKERGGKKKKKRSSGGIDKVFFLSCSDKRNPGHLSSLSRPVASSGPKSSSLSLEPVYTTLRRGGRVYQVGGGGEGGDQNLCIRRKEADSLVRVKRGRLAGEVPPQWEWILVAEGRIREEVAQLDGPRGIDGARRRHHSWLKRGSVVVEEDTLGGVGRDDSSSRFSSGRVGRESGWENTGRRVKLCYRPRTKR